MIRDATVADVPALTALEELCFDTDRMSARQFRYTLSRGNAALLVDEARGNLLGYGLVLFRRNTSLARLYSLAVDPLHRTKGIGSALLRACEEVAVARDAIYMRLEVRKDNVAATSMYHALGYRDFAEFPKYYEDSMDALQMEKLLVPRLSLQQSSVPYHAQSLEFTCGPACLMMAFKALDPVTKMTRMLELRLWREATTVFMTSGLGGCGALGLALAAWHRGFRVDVSVSNETEMFVDSVRSAEKKDVVRLVEQDFRNELEQTGVPVRRGPLSVAQLRKKREAGGIPIVLVSSYRLTGDRQPHWVLISQFDDRFAYVHDPFVDAEEGQTKTDCIGIPILHSELAHMMRFGRKKHFASVIVGPRRPAE
ncbi:MAG: GNAT family N-acetyltransferase/peptidase C39 family protein [Chloroflexi bacterium]|nr:GNAT family N-acetyltransferase/peptidase C39 family protein [Chloroflexota bacterium]